MPHQVPALSGRFDVAVIGAGVIGCAIARRLALAGARVAVIEKAIDILDGASKGNSAILHTGFDAPVGSLEQSCIAAGYEEYLSIHGRLGLPLIRSGAIVVAWTEEEEAILPALIEQARQNRIEDVEFLSGTSLRVAEPGLSSRARSGFRIPREYLIDPWSAPFAYLLQACENGAEILRGAEVIGGRRDGDWHLETTRGPVQAGLVINAAGLWGDLLDERLIGRRDFHIKPRKGQFIVYDKPAAALASHIILPVPTKVTKGVVVCRTAFDNLLVGPTAEDQDDREHAVLISETLALLQRRGEEILPGLKDHVVTAIYAGLRPATEFKDYQIRSHDGLSYITVGGIRSTGLSAALGIATHVERLAGLALTPPVAPVWPTVPNISEHAARDWQREGNGGVACHCEMVTRREILAALEGPLAARSLAGLKRRTRVTMGRCQGFFCTAELSRLTQDRFDRAMAEMAK
ncbi:NAD(P)/FAD-dependent oxidoreductase [Nordella sp. HKS 07]|uniref:NAD(P)/FAD-dependent oxidoreductase n=1 Tax=Nordella sp. HKS 07 TaxID=2712222 RepID=UPI0013E1D44B|nr:NAD(P)/FAD-dependent oxidoreductase [Nordella sp. HKS 07]QIG46320.1 NAD(P)/FAD-dependent oxidoreductase [Nordella sp. HKS 07]